MALTLLQPLGARRHRQPRLPPHHRRQLPNLHNPQSLPNHHPRLPPGEASQLPPRRRRLVPERRAAPSCCFRPESAIGVCGKRRHNLHHLIRPYQIFNRSKL
ncbi:unnamed protein product [Cuscuta epithymum]|uniref:Uncharacterized protein n=1 Tax=Cuscuta epithymum TaxID=186058 RepID=A0AAV0EHA3_9ASTE|nr:unnamed protein product [Cuscuta epithymum]